jgi:hypothetical protein
MGNLRASFVFYGFLLLPAIVLPGITMGLGFWIFTGAFAAAVILNFFLNLIKKYEKCDARYLAVTKLDGAIRLALLVGFFFLLRLAGVFEKTGYAAGLDRIKLYIAAACLGLAYIVFAFCALAIVSLGFEILGYTKNRSAGHAALIIMGIVGVALVVVAGFLAKLEIGMMVYLAAAVMAAFCLVTLIFAVVKKVIIKRNNLIDPILDALDEGYPIK